MKMSEIDKEEFKILCDYIKKNILRYSDELGFPKTMALRLKGLACNTHVQKKDSAMVYSYKIILLSTIQNKKSILYGLSHNDFKDETHKINYICKIIEKSLNDIKIKYNREIKERKMIENNINRIKNGDMRMIETTEKDYVKRENKIIKRDDLW